MVRPKSPALITSELMSYPSITSIVLFCAIPAVIGLYICILFTSRYWIPDNIAVLILGLTPTLFVLFQLYHYLDNPLLPTHEQNSNQYAKEYSNTFSHVVVESS